MLTGTALGAFWLWQQPDLLASDDALFFSRGLTFFSVMEFSPHFPGYPGFIWLGQALLSITENSTEAILFATRSSSLLLPWLSYGLLRAVGCSPTNALLGFLLCITEPLLLGLGLQGLSESPALCWLAAACWLIYCRQYSLTGLVFGVCLATRPSYAPIVLPLILWFIYYLPECRRRLLFGVGFIALISLGFVLAHDGTGYFIEGWRFIDGHFSLWGNSMLMKSQQQNWYQTVSGYYGNGLVLLIALAGIAAATLFSLLNKAFLYKHSADLENSPEPPVSITPTKNSRNPAKRIEFRYLNPELLITTILLISGLTWTLIAQNPDNLRHLAPIIWTGIILICLLLNKVNHSIQWLAAIVLTGASIWHMQLQLRWNPTAPAIHQAMEWLSDRQPSILVSNHGIELLRHNLPAFAVADAYYPGTAKRIIDQGGWRLSATQLDHSNLLLTARFLARSPADKPLWIYHQAVRK
ncbi:hypothetical protein BGP75_26135 [Motiliproteus sp. MSK22-1]|nr:hypothetical protein BGP75_26135 [Motiliproteus sp. MSK22-1]